MMKGLEIWLNVSNINDNVAIINRKTVPHPRSLDSFTVQGPRCRTVFLLNYAHQTYHIFRTTSRTRVLATPLFWHKICEKFLDKLHLSISRTFFLCFRVYRMLTDDEEIGKTAA